MNDPLQEQQNLCSNQTEISRGAKMPDNAVYVAEDFGHVSDLPLHAQAWNLHRRMHPFYT
jgi:hypothetical protein